MFNILIVEDDKELSNCFKKVWDMKCASDGIWKRYFTSI